MMQSKTQWRPVNTAEMISSPVFRGMYKIVQPTVEKWMGFDELAKIYEAAKVNDQPNPVVFAQNILSHLNVTLNLSNELQNALDEVEGPVIIASNHPYGCIDAMALMLSMERCRPDSWKIFANQLLRSIPELQPVILDVDPFGEKDSRARNLRAMREAYEHLANKGVLGMFPARRVSARSEKLGAMLDLPWTDHVVKLSRMTKATLIVIHMDGQNSESFLGVPVSKLLKRSLALAKEVPKQRDRVINVSLGSIYKPSEMGVLKKNGASKLLADCYSSVDREAVSAEESRKVTPSQNDTINFNVAGLIAELPSDCLIEGSEEFGLCLFQGKQASELLEQIGRARELTFQQIGAGSGNEVDITPEDSYYHHLVIWDKASGYLVGAYRIGFIQEIIREHGVDGVYLNHIFEFAPAFFKELGGAMELSRSFIVPSYQKNPKVLDLLWKGLGQAARLKNSYTMFGSVTISDSFSPLSQAVLVETLKNEHLDKTELLKLVDSKKPFISSTTYHSLVAEAWSEDGINRLNGVIEGIERGERSIPPLIRYYIALGAKFLAFNVEPTFNNAIYCLLRVDLKKMPPRYRKRFLGEV